MTEAGMKSLDMQWRTPCGVFEEMGNMPLKDGVGFEADILLWAPLTNRSQTLIEAIWTKLGSYRRFCRTVLRRAGHS